MSLIDAYQEELDSYVTDIRSSMAQLRQSSDQTEWSSCKSHVEDVLGKSTDIIKSMELEDIFAAFKAELTSLNFERQKSTLIGGKSGEDRRRMLDANERLANSNLVIEQSLRTLGETEDVGNEIMTELKSNREKIESSSQKTKEMGGLTDAANRMIKRMTKREWSMGFL